MLGDVANTQGQPFHHQGAQKWVSLDRAPAVDNVPLTRPAPVSNSALELPVARVTARPRVLAPSHGATSLRSLAIRVANAVKRLGPCTYGEVADSLVRDGATAGGTVDAMSVRRRVNDALNVLVAANVVVRSPGKVISWNWIFEGGDGLRAAFESLAEAQAGVAEREAKKAALEQQIRSFETLMTKNAMSESAAVSAGDSTAGMDSRAVTFPFVLVAMDYVDARFHAFGNHSRTNVDVTLEAPFQILDDRAVLERVISLPPREIHRQPQF